MILVIPGVNSYTPIKEVLNGIPYHVCDILVSNPNKTYQINKEMVKNSIRIYKPKIVIGKSYGGWIAAEGVIKNTPTFLFSMPLKNNTNIFGFPKIKNKNTHLIYSYQDSQFDKKLLEKYSNRYNSLLILGGDHSLRPITSNKISKIKKFIFRSSSTKNFNYFLESYLKKKENARVDIIKKTNFYEEIPLGQIITQIDPSLKFALNNKYGPITNVVKRKSPVRGLFVYQANILDTSKINPLVKALAATSGIGVSYNKKIAINKSIFEALERYSLTLSMLDFVIKKYEDIPKFLKINKKELVFHNNEQKEKYNLGDALKDKIHWVTIRKILDEKEKLYPLQLVIPNDIGYMFRETSSSGTALGKTKEQALTHGLKEAIERNSLMMWFYGISGVKSKKIKLNKKNIPSESIKIYTTLLKRGFKFNTYLIDFLGFNTIFMLAYNNEELYVGSSCGEFKSALSGALGEIVITSFFAKTLKGIVPYKVEDIKNLPQHFLYYQNNLKLELLNYLDSISNFKFNLNKSKFDYLNATKHLQKFGYEVYYKDVTAPELKERFFVGKVIIPGFLDVIKNSGLSWNKYYKVKKIPKIPTPFA